MKRSRTGSNSRTTIVNKTRRRRRRNEHEKEEDPKTVGVSGACKKKRTLSFYNFSVLNTRTQVFPTFPSYNKRT